jgi:hypothetical protein
VRRAAVLVFSAVAATAVLVGVGVMATGGDETPSAPRPTATPFTTTPLARYDTTGVVVARGEFCDRVDPRQVFAALGGDPAGDSSWRSGDKIKLANGVEDVAHEFGCRWTGADGTVAQAWVFAPPVAADQAQGMVRTTAKGAGCRPGAGPAFGAPTLALSCTKGGEVHASYRGLFGDAWLACEVARPAGATWDVTDRAGRWCVGVLEAARAS